MNDDVAKVDQAPLPLCAAFDPQGFDAKALSEPFFDVIGQCLDVDARRAGGDDEYVGEKEGFLHIEQDDVGSVLGEQGVGGRAGQFDTVLYDVVSNFMSQPTISSRRCSA